MERQGEWSDLDQGWTLCWSEALRKESTRAVEIGWRSSSGAVGIWWAFDSNFRLVVENNNNT